MSHDEEKVGNQSTHNISDTSPATDNKLNTAQGENISGKRQRWIHIIDLIGILLLTGILAWTMNYDPFKIIERTTDFNSSDFYDHVEYQNNIPPISRNVVIVASDDLISRKDIGNLLLRIGELEPAAIGLDIIMVGEKEPEGEILITEAIASNPHIVFPVDIDKDYNLDTTTYSFFFEMFPDYTKGVASFPRRSRRGVERYFSPEFSTADGERVASFALALSRMKDFETAERFMETADTTNRINFNLAEPLILFPHTVCRENIEYFQDKIVLIGDLHNPGDSHPTAVDESMPGVKLQAAAIETILSGIRIREIPEWVVIILTFIFVIGVTLLYSFFVERPWQPLAIIGVKIILLIIVLFGGYWLYTHYLISVDFTYTIAMLGFSLLICDIWFAVTRWLIPPMRIREEAKKYKSVENYKS